MPQGRRGMPSGYAMHQYSQGRDTATKFSIDAMQTRDYGDKCAKTPSFYAHDLSKVHRGQTSVRAQTGAAVPLGLSVSAWTRNGQTAITLVNPSHDTLVQAECSLSGVTATDAAARILHQQT